MTDRTFKLQVAISGYLHFRNICCLAQRLKRLPAMRSNPGLGRSPGEGNGNPLQYSCLENPMDGGAWRATVHGVAKSWTRLSVFTFTFTFKPVWVVNQAEALWGLLLFTVPGTRVTKRYRKNEYLLLLVIIQYPYLLRSISFHVSLRARIEHIAVQFRTR